MWHFIVLFPGSSSDKLSPESAISQDVKNQNGEGRKDGNKFKLLRNGVWEENDESSDS